MHRRFEHFLTTLVFTSAALAPAHAAELSEARVSSHIGQQLVADIELAMVDDPSAQVGVRLASPEVYKGAGVAMPPALASLTLSVMRREGRQFLHVTSLRPVDAEHLHLYLELTDKGQRAVRLVTLWLTPDPNPAPVPPPVAAPVQVPAPVQPPVAALVVPAPAPAIMMQPRMAPARTVAVAPPAPPQPQTPPQPQPKIAEARAPAPKVIEPKTIEPKSAEPKAAQAKPTLVLPVTRIKPVLPAAHGDAIPAACTQPSRDVQACTALDAKNAALRAQLGKLEEKVRNLQATLGVAATPAKAAADAPAKPTTIDARTMQQAQKTQDAHDAHAAAAKEAAKTAEHKEAPAPARAEPVAAAAAKEAHAVPPPEAAKPEEAAKPADAPKPPEPVKPAGPKPISSIKPLVAHKPKTPPDDSLPWGAIGAGVALLAALGGAAAFLMKRRGSRRNADIPADPGLLDKLKQRFAARNKGPSPASGNVEKIAEPSLE